MGQEKYAPSIISDEPYCFLCGGTGYLQRHEIFFGRNRQNSKKYGTWVNLCMACHDKVHFSKDPKLKIKLWEIGQRKFEEKYSKKAFFNVFGKDYS